MTLHNLNLNHYHTFIFERRRRAVSSVPVNTSSISPSGKPDPMIELEHVPSTMPADPLFRERFQALMEKSLADMKTFSERENRPLDETRSAVAEWHCSYLFAHQSASGAFGAARSSNNVVQSILRDTSQALETLYALSGVHAFILAVEPTTEGAFLGGTVLAREYWRGMRGGGEAGAKGLQAFCLKKAQPITSGESPSSSSTTADAPIPRAGTAKTIKAEVYTNVRDALRATCGIRTAEMKWSNHDRLSSYKVRLVGWPTSVPHSNPSFMTIKQNMTLLEMLADGTMRFERTDGSGSAPSAAMSRIISRPPEMPMEDISWAWKDNGPSVSARQEGQTLQPPEAADSRLNILSATASTVTPSSQDYVAPNAQRIDPPNSVGQETLQNISEFDEHTQWVAAQERS